MDLVIQHYPSLRYADLMLKACIETHKRHLGADKVHVIDFSEFKLFASQIAQMCLTGVLSGDFILTHGNTLLTGPITPSPYANKTGSWMHRKGVSQDAMVNTIRFLSEAGASQLIDFETHAPCAVNAEALVNALIPASGEMVMLRTLYFNSLGVKPVRIDDPLLPLWRHDHFPQGKIVALADTCYKSEQCRTWVRKAIKADAVSS